MNTQVIVIISKNFLLNKVEINLLTSTSDWTVIILKNNKFFIPAPTKHLTN